MNTLLIIANALVFLTFIVHTFAGDLKYQKIEPTRYFVTTFANVANKQGGDSNVDTVFTSAVYWHGVGGLANFTNFSPGNRTVGGPLQRSCELW